MSPSTVSIECLRAEHRVLDKRFPLFIGFLAADSLAAIAESPHFDLDTTHVQIAGNVLSDPVREWQRPLDQARAEEIRRTFSASSSEIMPNAVLLAAPEPGRVQFTPQSGRLWTFEVAQPGPGEAKPLWILDGQHRIAGLASSKHEIPFVLLASHNQSADYQESRFAKIFAQVTTTAEGLHPLHNEWLTYAFDLGKYDRSNGAKASQQSRAMETVVSLCHQRYLDEDKSLANPFFDKIAFNPGSVKRTIPPKPVGPSKGGFQYDAVELQGIIHESYFGAEISARPLEASEVATQLGLAYEALVEAHASNVRERSVLLNAPPVGHTALQNAYVHGVLRLLATHGVPDDWQDELRKRSFRDTDWSSRATPWAGERGGREGNINRRLARQVFQALFERGLDGLFLDGRPSADVDLGEYCAGDIGFGVELRGQRTGPNGRRLRFNKAEDDPMTTITAGIATSRLRLDTLRAISIGRLTPNVVAVEIREIGRPFEKVWSLQGLKSGMALTEEHLYRENVELRFEFTFYGGAQKDPKVKIDWSDAATPDA